MGPTGPRWAACWPHEPCYQEWSPKQSSRRPSIENEMQSCGNDIWLCIKQIWLCWVNSSFALIYKYCTMAIKEANTKRALYLHGLTLIPTWISNLAQMRRNAQHINIIQIFFAMIWGNCNWNIYFENLKNSACCSQCNLEMIDRFLISGKSELKNKKNIPDWVFLSCSNIIYF